VHDFRTPLLSALIVSAVDVGLSLWLRATPLRVRGLAVANSVAFTVGLVHLLLAARRRLRGLDGRGLLDTLGRMAIALVPFTAFLVGFSLLTRGMWDGGSTLRNLGILAAGSLVGLAILLGTYWLARIEMLRDVLRRRSAKK